MPLKSEHVSTLVIKCRLFLHSLTSFFCTTAKIFATLSPSEIVFCSCIWVFGEFQFSQERFWRESSFEQFFLSWFSLRGLQFCNFWLKGFIKGRFRVMYGWLNRSYGKNPFVSIVLSVVRNQWWLVASPKKFKILKNWTLPNLKEISRLAYFITLAP